jgi:hypothetical protein
LLPSFSHSTVFRSRNNRYYRLSGLQSSRSTLLLLPSDKNGSREGQKGPRLKLDSFPRLVLPVQFLEIPITTRDFGLQYRLTRIERLRGSTGARLGGIGCVAAFRDSIIFRVFSSRSYEPTVWIRRRSRILKILESIPSSPPCYVCVESLKLGP